MTKYILAIDQGTTSTRAMLFTETADVVAQFQIVLQQIFPQSGWVEHDPEEIWRATVKCCQQTIRLASISAKDVSAIGITNQRETTIIWDKSTGIPIYNAIVWQDRRTASYCQTLKQKNLEAEIQEKTGLLIDPYFSASKIRWLLDNIPQAREKASRGELAFGTIESFILWRLTNGRSHYTDITNAARTLLFNIEKCQWDEKLLDIFNIPKAILPQVLKNSADFGACDSSIFGSAIPISGMVGDQQAAGIGQACFHSGMVKSTYGTGCFILMNSGDKLLHSANRLLTTPAYHIGSSLHYALEGSIFIAGAAIEWLRDKIHLISHATESESIAKQTKDTGGVYVVPAFTGLGAPYWDPNARGAIFGLSRNSTDAHIVRATLESICYQTKDLLSAMVQDGIKPNKLRVDGGMVSNDWLMQFLADILDIEVERAKITETTALGAAFVAGLQTGIFTDTQSIEALWQSDKQFYPSMQTSLRDHLYSGWLESVERVKGS